MGGHEREQLFGIHALGHHEHDVIVGGEGFERALVLALPRLAERDSERPVDLAAPEGVQDDLVGFRG